MIDHRRGHWSGLEMWYPGLFASGCNGIAWLDANVPSAVRFTLAIPAVTG